MSDDRLNVSGARGVSRGGVVLFVVIAIYVTMLTWAVDYHSCERSNALREYMTQVLTNDQVQGEYPLPASLSCFRPLPQAGAK